MRFISHLVIVQLIENFEIYNKIINIGQSIIHNHMKEKAACMWFGQPKHC